MYITMPFDSTKLPLVILDLFNTNREHLNTAQDIKILHQAPPRILFEFYTQKAPLSKMTSIR